jgi:dihydrofolate reductase
VAQGSRIRVYIACSFDGFIAGPGDDLSWLTGADASASERAQATPDAGSLGFEQFMGDVGALLMGRRTYDVVAGFGGAWPYGKRPVLVATHHPLEPVTVEVRAVHGDIATMVAMARAAAGDKDVYIDGGALIRQAMDAGLIDDLVVTMVPVLLGNGSPLFAGVEKRHQLEFLGHHTFGRAMLQLQLRPANLTNRANSPAPHLHAPDD